MPELLNKVKIKFEVQTFITIMVFVFGLWVTWSSLSSSQKEILVKLDELAVQQQQMITKRDIDHTVIDARIGYIMPTIRTLAMIYKLPIYEWL